MDTLARIRMLIEVRAIEEAQPMGVIGKVRRHPIENHPNAMLVQGIDEIHKVLRRAIATCGSKETRGLVTPGTVEGVLHDGQELDVGESQALHVLGQPRSQLSVAEVPVVLLRHSAPGAKMHLIHRCGRCQGIAPDAFGHPRLVAPVVP